jgi:hypothetical protein
VEDVLLLLDPPHALTTSATIVALEEASRVSDGVSRSGRRSLTALLAFGDRIYSDLGRPERARHPQSRSELRTVHWVSPVATCETHCIAGPAAVLVVAPRVLLFHDCGHAH